MQDKAAWTESVPIYATKEVSICNVCGADITGNVTAHSKAHMLAGKGSGHHSEVQQVITGYNTVNHPAEGHWEMAVTGSRCRYFSRILFAMRGEMNKEEVLTLQDGLGDAMYLFAGVKQALDGIEERADLYYMCKMLGVVMNDAIKTVFEAYPESWEAEIFFC
ncbi:hypothetical protein [Adlercreutzia sp. ZJ304]|uniref:hypothetical protein n=1 Tax=Adlercreutzia sp. ZJ304 TaxID=2709791 RepID=UPI0013EB857D|nr:hypothetical protein [Adlercreutzia sp. ZJ304]